MFELIFLKDKSEADDVSDFASDWELVEAKAHEQEDDSEVGFGFGDGYDFGASDGAREANLKGISHEATAAIAVEADPVEV